MKTVSRCYLSLPYSKELCGWMFHAGLLVASYANVILVICFLNRTTVCYYDKETLFYTSYKSVRIIHQISKHSCRFMKRVFVFVGKSTPDVMSTTTQMLVPSSVRHVTTEAKQMTLRFFPVITIQKKQFHGM